MPGSHSLDQRFKNRGSRTVADSVPPLAEISTLLRAYRGDREHPLAALAEAFASGVASPLWTKREAARLQFRLNMQEAEATGSGNAAARRVAYMEAVFQAEQDALADELAWLDECAAEVNSEGRTFHRPHHLNPQHAS